MSYLELVIGNLETYYNKLTDDELNSAFRINNMIVHEYARIKRVKNIKEKAKRINDLQELFTTIDESLSLHELIFSLEYNTFVFNLLEAYSIIYDLDNYKEDK